MQFRVFGPLTTLASVAFLAACGGGGSSDSTAVKTGTSTSSAVALNLNDTYEGKDFSGDGSGYGGDGGGSADSGGAAGDGEFIKLSGSLPTGSNTSTLTWKVLRSQYGIQDSTGTISVQRDTSANGGGYKVTSFTVNGGAAQAVRVGQSNIFVSKKGQISGSLPLPINGGRDVAFTTVRFADAVASGSGATDFSDYAGIYVFGQMVGDVGTGANKSVSAGTVKINSDGTGRACGAAPWSATCASGIDVQLAFEDANARNLVRIRSAATQSQVIEPNASNSFDILAVFRKFDFPGTAAGSNTGLALTGDWLAWDSRNAASPKRTGIVYASRMTDASGGNVRTLSPVNLVGSWSFVSNQVSGASYKGYENVQPVNGAVKDIGGVGNGSCGSSGTVTQNSIYAGTADSTLPNGTVGFGFPIDSDTFVMVSPNQSLGVARRYSSATPGVGPAGLCIPS